MRILFIGWLAAVGVSVGSFLTVVTSRIPMGSSVVSPPSACPGCGGPIQWYDNIPVLSWVVLHGRCRRCEMAIPARYPALELGMGSVFGLVGVIARPLYVPVLVAAATGVSATVVAWIIHRHFSRRIAIVSVAISGLVAAVTVVARVLSS